MRLTKKLIKETKKGFSNRCKELCFMTEEELKKEITRCFPHVKYEGTHGELLNFMIQDLLELSFPTHWHE